MPGRMALARRGSMGRQIVASTDRVVYDTFTIPLGTAGPSVLFDTHGPDIGYSWTQHPQYLARGIGMDSVGRLWMTGGTTGTCVGYVTPIPPSADADVSTWIDRVTVSASEFIGPAGRIHPTNNTMLLARYSGVTDTVELIELTNNVATQTISSGAITAWGLSSQHKLTLRMRGNQISVLVDDVQVVPPTTVAITATNYAGVRLLAGAGTSATTGMHVRKFEVLDFGNKSGPASGEPTVQPGSNVKRTNFPTKLNSRNGTSSQPFSHSNLITYNGNQYGVWVDASRKPIIGKRALPDGDWTTTFDLGTVAGNPLDVATLEDGHNVYSIGIASDGIIHVSGNMHDVALNYVHSTAAESISAWTASGSPTTGMTSSVTYPDFLTLPSGNMLLFTRHGIAGNGDYRMAKYTASTHTWSANTKIFDGVPTSESPYINRACVGPDNTIHLFFVWRSGSTGNDNGDICHIKSTDEGTTWKDMAGNTITLPVVHGTSPLILDTAASGSGLLNAGGSAVDTKGRPHAGFFLYDAAGKTQAYHVWHNGSAWQIDRVTSWTYRLDLTVNVVDFVTARPQIFCPQDGSTWMLLRHNVDKGGRYYLQDVTPDRVSAGTSLGERTLWKSPTYYLEAVIDDAALRDRNELHVLIVPTAPVDTANADMQTVLWQSVSGWVASVRVADFDTLASG